ncbi:transcriptional regulator, LysR family [Paraburkholderia caribensis MBA4]|uniref:Transcriptional regulator, LysR family n=1 Tax=Paraburkholderia caribensis MBA4 TaxID=1323664 RepID=A0A0P0RIN4_9BURK|nr:transcriptional regulator GcvA [Paraburkholderia caribensis]ALL68368.1 transcriptional regulator, LysR family [Paraburkholderia caribensis MBA4]
MRTLAYLNSLRAFEAAARHLSFAGAAKELNVTPAAIGQQVRALESWLGVSLFQRVGGPPIRLELTPIGIAALPDLSAGFDQLATGLGILKGSQSSSIVNVTASPAFAAKWLLPRMYRFQALHPYLDARLDASDKLVDIASGEADLGVRLGGGRWPGLSAIHLIDEEVFPVCSPQFLDVHPDLVTPADLSNHTLIHDTALRFDANYPNWRKWLDRAGVRGMDYERGLAINSSAAVTQAAIEGQGIALGRSIVVADDVAHGRLVRLFPQIRFFVGWAYYIVHRADAAKVPRVTAFIEWLLSEAQTLRDSSDTASKSDN